MDEMNLDYKQMYENLQKLTVQKAEQEQHYFDLLCKFEQLKHYGDIISKNIAKLPMADQIKVFESIVYYNSICKTLVEKHNIDEEAH